VFLGGKRRIIGLHKALTLSYIALLVAEKSDIDPENTYFWGDIH
jgi:hypothetical protein